MSVFTDKVIKYFQTLDSSLETLSKKKEKKVAELPSWTFSFRDIYFGMCDENNLFIMKAIPNSNLSHDNLIIKSLKNDSELNELCIPWKVSFSLSSCPKDFSLITGDWLVEEVENPLAPPVSFLKGLFIVCTKNHFDKIFSVDEAKRDALNMWNSALNNLSKGGSFIRKAQEIFTRFRALIRRKAFLERRIHRYINSYRFLLLPKHKNCFFEHKLFLSEEYRITDFILEQEKGMPALLIELESPSSKLFKKNGEFTAEANHAKNQIAEWVKFIEQNPDQNAKGEMDFLNAKKQRLVIMGSGMEYLDKMLDSRYSDTIMWTYDLFLNEGIERLNNIVSEQCRILGIEPAYRFR